MIKKLWFPTIFLDVLLLQGNLYVFNFCPHGVLEVREDEVSVVNPLGCIYDCSAYADLCPKDAIIFLSKEIASGSIKKKALLQSHL